MFTVGGRGDNVCAICSSSRPCDHCFLCFECCERFRAEAGDICNGCREESSIERVRFVNDRTTERHMLAAAAAVEDETLLESQPTPRSLNLDALTQVSRRLARARTASRWDCGDRDRDGVVVAPPPPLRFVVVTPPHPPLAFILWSRRAVCHRAKRVPFRVFVSCRATGRRRHHLLLPFTYLRPPAQSGTVTAAGVSSRSRALAPPCLSRDSLATAPVRPARVRRRRRLFPVVVRRSRACGSRVRCRTSARSRRSARSAPRCASTM